RVQRLWLLRQRFSHRPPPPGWLCYRVGQPLRSLLPVVGRPVPRPPLHVPTSSWLLLLLPVEPGPTRALPAASGAVSRRRNRAVAGNVTAGPSPVPPSTPAPARAAVPAGRGHGPSSPTAGLPPFPDLAGDEQPPGDHQDHTGPRRRPG